MSKILAFCLDDGHGMETTYKSSKITGMRENDFNRNVVKYLIEYCKLNNILYKEVAVGDTDIPLITRTNIANAWYAELKRQYGDNVICLYLSCHANLGGGTGSEIWIHSQATDKVINVANSVLNEITSSLNLRNRGVKKGFVNNPNADFHVNRETNMISMLIEYAFMDNTNDCYRLLEDNFRQDCAKATIKGILNYLELGNTFVDFPNISIPTNPNVTPNTNTTNVKYIKINTDFNNGKWNNNQKGAYSYTNETTKQKALSDAINSYNQQVLNNTYKVFDFDGTILYPVQEQPQPQVNNEEVEKLKSDKQALIEQVNSLIAERNDLNNALSKIETELEKQKSDNQALIEQINFMSNEMNSLTEQLNNSKLELEAHKNDNKLLIESLDAVNISLNTCRTAIEQVQTIVNKVNT